MSSVGIIANPASGRDIRRLVAHASVFDNNEKVNIVRRVLMGLEAVGTSDVWFMPDYYDIGGQALDGLHVKLNARPLPLAMQGDDSDSARAAEEMAVRGCGCIVTLGGDGTNRAVSKGCGEVPIVPLSTGTNNVFPTMMEGTIAGLAAGLVAAGQAEVEAVAAHSKRLDVYVDGRLRDVALIDAAVTRDPFVGARAVWEMSHVTDLLLTRSWPGNIGLSAIGASLCAITPQEPRGMYLRLGPGRLQVLAAVGPGHVEWLAIERYEVLDIGEERVVGTPPCTIALDGEREVEVRAGQTVAIRLTQNGPRVVDIRAVLEEATKRGLFLRES